jgi:NAD(P)-dependent dehydrogenase (short-subunit alcohol dehydrogenase family)
MDDFQDQVVLITGAGRGLGRALACTFARRGAIVAASDVTPVTLDGTLHRARAGGGRIRDYIFDVGKYMPAESLVDQVVQDWGRIDVLVNAAAVRPLAAVLEMDEWDWRRTLEVNLTGAFFLTKLAGRVMREQGGGAVVNIAASYPMGDPERQSAFLSSKFGLLGLTRSAAAELAPFGVRVNAVCPPGLQAGLDPDADLDDLPADLAGASAGGPWVIETILNLCRRSAAGVTGQIVSWTLPVQTQGG